ncbi:hypothetical protein KP509_1Z064000 [Ceratopteris richardii]|nr:hypothetical protein KP509_1Z064000 [Ceratopteris richardii]
MAAGRQYEYSRTAMFHALAIVALLACIGLLPLSSEAAGGGARPRKTVMIFYLHNVMAGSNATAVQVGAPFTGGNTSRGWFGRAFAMDAVLTRRSYRSSKEVGAAQGVYIWESTTREEGNLPSIILFFTITFNDKTRYEDSSIIVQGSVGFDKLFREVAIVGGTGRFRLAQGFASLDPISISPSAVVLNISATIYH